MSELALSDTVKRILSHCRAGTDAAGYKIASQIEVRVMATGYEVSFKVVKK